MVQTRKRSCSASEPGAAVAEAPQTPRAAKLKKQDEGAATPVPRTTPRCVDSGGTPAPTTIRRTRRVTDSVLDAAPQSPRPSRTTRASNYSSTQGTRTPVKAARKGSSSDGAESDSLDGRQLRVTLRDVGTPSTPSARSRRVPRGEAGGLDSPGVNAAAKITSSDSLDAPGTPTTVSTPVRRSRRLSGSGVEELQSQGTPRELSFSNTRITGGEGRKTKEDVGNKQSSLPVIEEDTEQTESKNISLCSPKKDTQTCGAEEDEIKTDESSSALHSNENMEKPNSAEQTLNVTESCVPDLPLPAEGKKSCPAPERQDKLGCEKTVDLSVCDGKPSIKNTNEDSKGKKKDILEVTKSSAGNKENSTLNDTDVEGQKKDIVEVTKPSAGDKEDTISNDTDVEGKTEEIKTSSKEEEEQISAISTSDAIVETAKPVNTTQKDTPKTAPNGKVTNKSSTTQDTKVTSSAQVDENGNKNFKDVKQIMAGDKKLLKVIPELEKKIEQIRSIPKGQSISGKKWKKDKQRFRSIIKDASGKKKWSKKMQLKQWREDVMAKSATIEAEKQKKKEELKERQRINKIRTEENAKKAEIVQVIKDPRKIKKMKRKQLRYIETRDISNVKQV